MVCELRAYVESAYNLPAKVVISSEMRYTFSRNRYLSPIGRGIVNGFYCTSLPLMPRAAIKL